MSLWRHFVHGLRVLRNRKAADKEIADEVDQYLEESTAEFLKKGLSPEEARRAALLELGGRSAIQQQIRAYGWENMLETILADLRYAGRRLTGNPGFTIVAILTLGLGIGASTSIFSVVDAVLLRPLPYPNPEKIVRVWEQASDGQRMNLADPNFDDFRNQNDTFTALAAYGNALTSVSGGSEPARVNVAEVSSDFFKSLGVQPFRGRAFAPEEQRLHGTPAAIVSYGYWRNYLGGASDLSKFHLRTGGAVLPVIGVMPKFFDFPASVAVWIPRNDLIPSRTAHNWRVISGLRDGITVAQARANLSAIADRIKHQYGKDADLTAAAVMPLVNALVGDVKASLLTLLAAVGLLLLVACTNVAGLLLARTSARRKELAVCVALGAGRFRLIQQLLTESFILSFGGGALGILIAYWAVKLLPAILPASLPRQQDIAINSSVLLFALASVIVVALPLGLLAAWHATAGDLQSLLAAGSRNHSATPASQRLRGFLVAGEIATTLVIMIVAGLLGRSFLRLISTSPGFRPQNLITMEFSPPDSQWQLHQQPSDIARQVLLMDRLMTRLRTIPGVDSVGLSGAIPVAAGDNLADGDFLLLNGQKPPTTFEEWGRIAKNRSAVGHAEYCVAGDGYFQTLGIPLVRGRMFAEHDDANSQHVAVISESLALERWPNQDPIGQVIDFANMDGILNPLTIVGIVADVRGSGLDRPPNPVIYVNFRQRGMNGNSDPTIFVRSLAPAGEIASAAHRIFRELAPEAPVKVSTFDDELGGWLAARRFLLLLVVVFATSALALAAIGIYGVVAFSVTRRTQEIGIRMALGAQRTNVLRLVVGEGAQLALLGVVIGIAASFAATRLLSSLLFGVSATDPLTFFAVALLLCLVALLASYLPARRAMRLDPNSTLRCE